MENSAGDRRDDRPLDRRVGGSLRPARRPSPAGRLPRLVPSVRVRLRRDRRGGAGRGAGRGRPGDRARPVAGAARERLGRPARLERDRHENIEDGLMGKKLGVFLGHPRLQGLPAVLEVPGPDGHGPNAEEVAKAKKLHRSGVRAATPSLGRRSRSLALLRQSPRPQEPSPNRTDTPGPAACLPPFFSLSGNAHMSVTRTSRDCANGRRLRRSAEPARRPGNSARRAGARRTRG